MNTVAVPGIPCPCPSDPLAEGPRHPDGDTVELRERLGLAAGLEIQTGVRALAGVDEHGRRIATDGAITAVLIEGFVRHGVVAWTFEDEKGAVPVTPETIQTMLLDDFTLATPVGEAADKLYGVAVVGPLVEEAAILLRSIQTAQSTSVPAPDLLDGSDTSPMPSSPSSTTSTPTDDTETTSSLPDGGYKLSPIEPMDLLREAV